MQPDVLIYITSYTFLPTLALLWFLIKVRPKFPSGLTVFFVVFFGLALIYGVLTIMEFLIAPISVTPVPIGIGYGVKISLVEETTKLITVALGVLIAKEEARSVNVKLSLAFVSGLTFAVTEVLFYLHRESYSAIGVLFLCLTRLIHPVFTITLVGGIVLMRLKRPVEGSLAVICAYLSHALLDHYISNHVFYAASAVILLELLSFVGVLYLLMPIINAEKKRSEKAMTEATVDIHEHWLNKIENVDDE